MTRALATAALVGSLGCAGDLPKDLGAPTGETGETGETGAPERPFVLLSLNLHCLKLDGTPYTSTAARFAAIASLVQDEDVAVIAAAELCDDGVERAQDLLEDALEDATGADWSQVSTVAHIGWEGTDDEAEESVGLYARGALTDAGSLTYTTQGGLNRVATYATLPAALGGAVVWSVHLDAFDATVRLAQARETAAAALALGDPSLDVLVAGDFNDVEGSDPHSALGAMGFGDLSAGLGADRIDHVFAHRGAAWAVAEARLAFDGGTEEPVSDHPGVLVRLGRADPDPVPITRLTASAALSEGATLSVRGGTAPLDWGWGWPGQPGSDGAWRVVLTELPEGEPFEYKWLIDDSTWQTGDNAVGTGGADNAADPSF